MDTIATSIMKQKLFPQLVGDVEEAAHPSFLWR